MGKTRNRWLAAAQGAGWFSLTRHDDPDPQDPVDPELADPEGDPNPADPDPDPVDPDPDPDPEGADKLGDAGKKALDRMKVERAAAKKEAADAKKRAAAAEKKVQEFEDRDKTELDKAKATAERADRQVAKANERAVTAEVKALSIGKFADPSDAVEALVRDPAKYIGDDGEIDTDAIEADLSDLLERKPHWAVPTTPEADPKPPTDPKTGKRPKPDPGQGARPAAPPTDFRTAPPEEVAAELAKYGVQRRYQ